jgi:hypothetical protein
MGRLGWLLAVVGGAVAVGGLAYAASGGSAQAAAGTTGTTGPTPTPTVGALPAGPYANLGKGAKLQPGNTYLMSKAGDATSLATDAQAMRGLGLTVINTWTSPPSGWPSDDTITSGEFVAVSVPSTSTVLTNGADVTTWATGGASS